MTLNYRLGLLGCLANPALDSEGHDFGDYGIMDQQAALRCRPTDATTGFLSGRYNHMPVMGSTVEEEGNFGLWSTEYFSGPPRF